jgi:carboxylesterase type B
VGWGHKWSIDTTEDAVKYTRKLAQRFNCDTEDTAKIAECLRSKSLKELLTEAKKEAGLGFDFEKENHFFRPSIEAVDDEDAFLTEHPMEIMLSGRGHRVPWMLGVNAHEGLMISLAFYGNESAMESYEKNWTQNTLKSFSIPAHIPNAEEIVLKICELYLPSTASFTKEQKLQQYTNMFSDAMFILHTSFAAEVQRKFSPVYSYYYNRRGAPSLGPLMELAMKKENVAMKAASVVGFFVKKLFNAKPRDLGVCHTDALCMLFRLSGAFTPPNLGDNAEDIEFSRDIVKLWVDFSTTDETQVKFRGVHFEAQQPEGVLRYLELNEVAKMIDEPFRDRTDFLKSLKFLEQCK